MITINFDWNFLNKTKIEVSVFKIKKGNLDLFGNNFDLSRSVWFDKYILEECIGMYCPNPIDYMSC